MPEDDGVRFRNYRREIDPEQEILVLAGQLRLDAEELLKKMTDFYGEEFVDEESYRGTPGWGIVLDCVSDLVQGLFDADDLNGCAPKEGG